MPDFKFFLFSVFGDTESELLVLVDDVSEPARFVDSSEDDVTVSWRSRIRLEVSFFCFFDDALSLVVV